MPYKNKELQKEYLREWGEEHREEGRWRLSVWRKGNVERNKQINHEYYMLNKNFCSAVNNIKRKLDKEELI